ncbi:hypothetical protein BDP27DRAFT_1328068 [Rhodocollybia butyracea]|uniref:Uncharacterized protein n=1 Tax=Rhodocollybia butyracea TaxID=206335 RepID=A0A9P5U6P4_9AGAR|nr:hypothetical protein BDP27DRAFT_1328068 [Rhodocollybia butyracea]
MQSPPSYSTLPVPAEEEQSTGQSSGIRLAHDADVLIRTYITPASAYTEQASLPLPICIPQAGVNPKAESGFCRGYPDALEIVGISQGVFLNFIDGLNMAISASPPLRVVDFAGKIIGLVPYHWAMIAGMVINISAGVAIHVLSKTLTDRYLRAANLKLFKPRGLSVRLCTTPAMLALVDSESKSKPRSKLNKFGRGLGSVLLSLPIPVIQPIASTIIHAVADKPRSISPTGRPGDPINSPTLGRRLAMIQDIALPLNVQNLPPPAKPQGVIDTMAYWGVKFDNAQQKSSEKRLEQRRRALQSIKEAGFAPPSSSRLPMNRNSSSSSSVKSVASRAFNAFQEHRLQREIEREQVEQERNRMTRGSLGTLVLGQRMTNMERKIADADLVESWGTDKILWIVIMPSEKDDEIADVGIAEDPADEERIDDRTWRAEMEFERDEMELDDIMMQELSEQQRTGGSPSGKH